MTKISSASLAALSFEVGKACSSGILLYERMLVASESDFPFDLDLAESTEIGKSAH